MATVTPNFNWPVPTSTDLVKDGATAIEALGDSIDASLVDLKGGTSGQVLSKNSNTDMDFVWVTSDDANAIQNTIVDAKGDLITATAADTPARLAVGSNGETLVADSSTSTGLRYTAGTVQSNPFLNSAFQVWQRGTSIAQTAAIMYGADRWCSNRAGFDVGTTISRQATGDTTNLPNIQYAARVQRNSGTTATTAIYFSQSIETINSIPFMGKTVTFSFYARAGANFSSASNALSVSALTGTGTDQNVLSVWTGASSLIGGTQTATLTTTWQRFTYTGTASATGTEIGIYFNYTPVGTAGANDHFEITGVQLDIGSVALPFRTNGETIQGELAACQRYYWRNTAPTATAISYAIGRTSTQADIVLTLPVTMRTNPTAVESSGTFDFTDPNVGAWNLTSFTFVHCSYQTAFIKGNTASGLSQGKIYELGIPTNGYLGFSAEL